MKKVKYLIVGGGITGISFANFKRDDDYLILEGSAEIGGYCKTVRRGEFVWDYSGHFFHFQDPEIHDLVFRNLDPADLVRVTDKVSSIHYRDHRIDFPFQKNIHQLPKDEFIECLCDLFERSADEPASFKQMVTNAYGRGIAEKFLIPYNEKLYCIDLDALDRDAMGRFFPHASVEEIVANFRHRGPAISYNQSFTYHKDGAYAYIRSLADNLDSARILLNKRVESVDLAARTARTADGDRFTYEYLVNTSALDGFLGKISDRASLPPHDPSVFTANKVLVFNIGFDRGGDGRDHWVYFPEDRFPFYRVGFYNNILGAEKLSLYVEVGLPREAAYDEEKIFSQVLAGLHDAGIIGPDHRVIERDHVVMNPAYVHVREWLEAAKAPLFAAFARSGAYSIGRYGEWKYCSIEDNILDAKNLSNRI